MTPEHRRTLLLRLGAVALLGIGLLVVGHFTGLGSVFSIGKMRTLVLGSGSWGVAIYVGFWIVGLLVHVPGLVFVAAGVLAWGHWWGGLAAYCGAFLAALLSFAIVRAVGGKPMGELTQPRIVAILRRIEHSPILTVATLRSFLMAAPALNYALALSPIGWRPHLIGTALGLIPSVAVMSAFFGVVLK